jgi:FdhD protein
VDEGPVWIAINGVRSILLTCSPAETDALAVGHLIGEGWIRSAAEVRSLRTVSGPAGACGVEVEIDDDAAAAAAALRRHLTAHGCGVRHVLDCVGPQRPLPPRPATTPPLTEAFRALFAIAETASPDGGVHAAALYDAHGLHHAAVDVARHCAVDRVIGLAALAGDELARYGLVSTARVSGAIAAKAARAGVAWLASRSVATPLAREIAAAGGLTIHERAARPRRPDA